VRTVNVLLLHLKLLVAKACIWACSTVQVVSMQNTKLEAVYILEMLHALQIQI